jgi:acyl-CoA thioesterase FadM
VELTTRYKKPVPLGQALRVIGRITRDTSRIFEGTGEILLEDGSVAVEGRGKYLRFPIDQIAEFDLSRDWRVVSAESDPEEIEV